MKLIDGGNGDCFPQFLLTAARQDGLYVARLQRSDHSLGKRGRVGWRGRLAASHSRALDDGRHAGPHGNPLLLPGGLLRTTHTPHQ